MNNIPVLTCMCHVKSDRFQDVQIFTSHYMFYVGEFAAKCSL